MASSHSDERLNDSNNNNSDKEPLHLSSGINNQATIMQQQQQQHLQTTPAHQQQDLIQLLAQHFHQQFSSQFSAQITPENIKSQQQQANLFAAASASSAPTSEASKNNNNNNIAYHLQRYQNQQVNLATSERSSPQQDTSVSPATNLLGTTTAASQAFGRHLFGGQQNNLAHLLGATDQSSAAGSDPAHSLATMQSPLFHTPSALESFLSLAQRAAGSALTQQTLASQQLHLPPLAPPHLHLPPVQVNEQLVNAADLSLFEALGFGALTSNSQLMLSLQQQQHQSIAAASDRFNEVQASRLINQQRHQADLLEDKRINPLDQLAATRAACNQATSLERQCNGSNTSKDLKFSINTILGRVAHSSTSSSPATQLVSPPINGRQIAAQRAADSGLGGRGLGDKPIKLRDDNNEDNDEDEDDNQSIDNNVDNNVSSERAKEDQVTSANILNRNQGRLSRTNRRFLMGDSASPKQPPIDCSSSSAMNHLDQLEVEVDSNSNDSIGSTSRASENQGYSRELSPFQHRSAPVINHPSSATDCINQLINAQNDNATQITSKHRQTTGESNNQQVAGTGLGASDLMHQNACLGLLSNSAAARSAIAQANMISGSSSLRLASQLAGAQQMANRQQQQQQQQNHLNQHHLQHQQHQQSSLVHPLPLLAGSTAFPWTVAARGKPRRGMMRRAVFSDSQRVGLEKRFQLQKYISKPDRKKLAEKLGLRDSQVKIWFQNRRMKWRNSKERELLSAGGSREQTLPTRNNPNPDLSDVGETVKRLTANGGASANKYGDNESTIYTGTDLLRSGGNSNSSNGSNNNNNNNNIHNNKDSDMPRV